MGRKGKTQKHTAKEIAGKVAAAKMRNGAAGHGAAGAAARQAAMQKIQVKCDVCLAMQPHMSGMKAHYESKHPKAEFKEEFYATQFQSNKAQVRQEVSHVLLPKKKEEKDKAKGGEASKSKKKKKNDLSLLEGY